MFRFETTDPKEARRCRIAQFNGRSATIRSAGKTVTGRVHSIVENKATIPASWTITIVSDSHASATSSRSLLPIPA